MGRLALVIAAACWLAACASRPAPRPVTPPRGELPSAAQIFGALAQRRETIRGLRAMARLSYTAPDESRRAKQLMVVERPDRLRLEVLSPFGAVFVLTTADGTLAAWTREESTVYRGSASSENLQRYVALDLSPATAVDLLLGTPPLLEEVASVVSADGADVELWQDAGPYVQVAWFTPGLDPLRFEQRRADGRVLLRTTFGEYAAVGGQRVATALGIELPLEQRRIDVTLRDPELNPVVPADVFVLATPAGSREVDIDEAAP